MAFNFRKFLTGINIIPKTPLTGSAQGDLEVDSATGKLNYHNGSASAIVPTVSSTDTLTNKTLDNTNTATLKDTLFTIQDDGDTSKQAKFQASAITTATTRTFTLPDANDTFAVLDATQTLTNKTISGASNTITNVSLTTGVTGILPVANGGTGSSSVVTTPTASTNAAWDANANLSADNFIAGYATTVTSGTPVVLTVDSKYQQFFTGSSAQTVTLPVASTMVLGQGFHIVNNNSAGSITVNSSGGNLVVTIGAGTAADIVNILTSGTTAASWSSTASVPSIIPVANGGTGITSGTSGGVLGFTASGTIASSAALGASELVLGGGAGATPTSLGSKGTTTTVLHGNAAGAPTFGAVSLTADVSGTLPVANGGTNVTSVTTAPTATSFAGWDANANLSADSFIAGYATTATAAGTTTLTVDSKQQQYFTGTTTQTVVLPVTSTLVLGQSYWITNNSTGIVTVQSSGANAILSMSAGATAIFTVILTSGTTAASWNAAYTSGATVTPTIQKFTSGTAQTYTTPANVAYIKVRMVGGGGGGSGSGSTGTAGNGTNGTDSTFGTSLLTAALGTGGSSAATGGGAGGAGTISSPAVGTTFTGGKGGGGTQEVTAVAKFPGGYGGATPFGQGGPGLFGLTTGATAATNTGAGGGGGGVDNSTSDFTGTGGGGGGYVEAIIANPSATYTYTVGTGGSGGSTGTNGAAGGNGAAGYIEVTEYYLNASLGNGGAVTPTVQKFTSSSGTYTTPSNVAYLIVKMVGGGGGGAGSGSGSFGAAAGNGTSSTFGSSLLTASGANGAGVNSGNGSSGSSGGTGTISAPAIGTAITGTYGQGGRRINTNAEYASGPNGGSTALFGGGGAGVFTGNGNDGVTNTGGGGAGGGSNNQAIGLGGAGGAGGSVYAIIFSPSATYAYTVGAGGSAGGSGTNGFAGGAGAAGYIEVTEYYNNGSIGTATNITASTNSTLTSLDATAGVDIKGTNTNDAAAAGYVGEYVVGTASATNLPTSTNYGDLVSGGISLTAGDWEITGGAYFDRNTASQAAFTVASLGISTTTGNSSTGLTNGDNLFTISDPSQGIGTANIYVPPYRVSLSATTTYYLKFKGTYSANQPQAAGRISARRLR